jgi:sulfatase modifying factor 1
MKLTGILTTFCTLLSLTTLARPAAADMFGIGDNAFDIQFVTVGNPGNAPDTTGDPNPVGAVQTSFRIGKFEVSEQMIDKANAVAGLGITKNTRGPDKPATSTSWFEAARFVNWLNTSTGHAPAYKFDAGGNFQLWEPADAGYDAANRYRNTGAEYFLPNVNEWYKAAYFNPAGDNYFNYPTGSDSLPTAVASGTAPGTAVYNQPFGASDPADVHLAGWLSPYGTMGQGGNVWEWEETSYDLLNATPGADRAIRGGVWIGTPDNLPASYRNFDGASVEGQFTGFRVASRGVTVPEPTAAVLLMLGSIGAAFTRRRPRS